MSLDAVQTIRNETLTVLKRHLCSDDRIALLDFPAHQNAGDSLIFAGERQYLETLGVEVSYISDLHRFDHDSLVRKVPNGTILLHGGGNFGDRWPAYQNFREYIIKKYKNHKIIVLPQSIEYMNREPLDSARRVFSKHPNLTILTRETRSYNQATNEFGDFNSVEYCPDLAFGAKIATAQKKSTVDLVRLMRRDSERISHGSLDSTLTQIEADWGLAGMAQIRWKAVRAPGRIVTKFPTSSRLLYPILAKSYEAQADLNLTTAQNTLQQGRIILTDRLHAAVLAGLMGLSVIALDNSYGKVSSIYSDYLGRLDNVSFAANADEARNQLHEAAQNQAASD